MLKRCNRCYAYQPCYCRHRISIAWGPWHFGDFRKIFLPNIDEDQKKVSPCWAGHLAAIVPYYGKSGPNYCITVIKSLDEGLK